MRRTLLPALLPLLLSLAACAAEITAPPVNAGATETYSYLRQLRDSAQMLSAPNASQDDLRQALARYEAALAYLATPPVAERATGNLPLYAENINVLLPLADTYARLGMKEKALDALESVQRVVWLPALSQVLSQMPGLASLGGEARFKAVMRTSALPKSLYGVPAIATPYKEELSVEERVAGLSLFWAEARQSFVHFDHVPELEWDKVYMDYLGKVIAAKTTRDYYRVLRQLAPLLQDGHTNIEAPAALAGEIYARPPLRTVMVEGKVLVQYVGNDALRQRLRVGDEIVAIDGKPVRQYADEQVAPFVSASTPQDKAMRTYTYQLLAGDASKPLKLRVRAADGAERDEVVERGGSYRAPESFVFKMLPGEIAYISIDEFEDDRGVKAFERALPEIFKAKGLLIDVRRNGGGNSNFGERILSYLSQDPIYTPFSYVRSESAVSRAQQGSAILWAPLPGNGRPLSIKREQVFKGPVAVLIGPQTFSAAEDFAATFKIMKRGLLVGQASGGSTGQPLNFALPGGGSARICVKRDVYPDGSAFVGKGVLPDVEAPLTVAAVREQRDVVLESALLALRK